MWWQNAVVYQIYPRSFQDSDGDGVGDLRGIAARLDHLVELGVDALWLSPIYPSPLADFGYDVTDHTAVDPVYGTLADLDALVERAHASGLRLLMDLVPCHTSIEHPWFREHPDWYIWADRPNNWVSAFGGPAWSYDEREGRFYLHSFYPEQPDLDWRNPDVVAAMQGVVRFWIERGVDGYRVDAIDRLLKDAELRDDPPAHEPFGLPVAEHEKGLALSRSRNAPDTGAAVGRIREAAGDAFVVGEIYLPSFRWQPYLEHLDAAFAFELLHARWDAGALRSAIEAAYSTRRPAWVLSNHDFGRLGTRFGEANARAAAMLLLTLPGPGFLYQGDEIGMLDGAPSERVHDRAGRDRYRHPMQWDASPNGGFTSGTPWLPPVDPPVRSVASQRDDPHATLNLVRRLIGLRPELGDRLRMLAAEDGVLAFDRGDYAVAINTTVEPRPVPLRSEPLVETSPGALRNGRLAPHGGAVVGARSE